MFHNLPPNGPALSVFSHRESTLPMTMHTIDDSITTIDCIAAQVILRSKSVTDIVLKNKLTHEKHLIFKDISFLKHNEVHFLFTESRWYWFGLHQKTHTAVVFVRINRLSINMI